MGFREGTVAALTLALVSSATAVTFAAEGDAALADALRATVAGSIAAYDKKEVDASMSFVDTASPDYESTKAALAEQFKDVDAKAELVDFDYVGHDDEFAVARVKIKTTAKPGSAFVDNTVDSMMIFHYKSGAWKIWTEKVLGVETSSGKE